MTKAKPKTAAAALIELKGGKAHTWQWLAEQLQSHMPHGKRVNPGYLHQIATGARRAPNDVIIAINTLGHLHIKLHEVPATPCQHCGQVPMKKSCNCRRAARPPKPRQWHRVKSIASADSTMKIDVSLPLDRGSNDLAERTIALLIEALEQHSREERRKA
jgi:hypothetical protein